MTTKLTTENLLILLEQELHSALTRANYARLNDLIAEDFYEFGSSGNVWNKNDILSRLPSEDKNAPQILSRNFDVKKISADVYFLTYVSYRMINGKEERTALRSSLWKKNAEEWQMIFHQGTFKV